MAIKVYKPITPGQRGMTGYSFDEITKDRPERSLVVIRKAHDQAALACHQLRCHVRPPGDLFRVPFH